MQDNKLHVLELYSDIDEVNRRAHELGLNPVYPSSQKKFKYMIFNGHNMIHFGLIGFQDFTKSHDKRKRELFRKRNWRWEYAPRYTRSWLSWHLTW